MSDEYKNQLKKLVAAGKRMRQTAIVDDDFCEMRDRFDAELHAAEELLKEKSTA